MYEDAVDEIRSAVSKEEAYVHAGAPSDKPVEQHRVISQLAMCCRNAVEGERMINENPLHPPLARLRWNLAVCHFRHHASVHRFEEGARVLPLPCRPRDD